MDEAVEAAASILTRADLPLIYGLGNSTCESQRAAIMLAEDIGGVIDTHTSMTHGPSKLGAQLVRQGHVHARRSAQPRRPVDLLGHQSGRNASAALHAIRVTPRGKFVPGGTSSDHTIARDSGTVRGTLSARAGRSVPADAPRPRIRIADRASRARPRSKVDRTCRAPRADPRWHATPGRSDDRRRVSASSSLAAA